MLTVNRRIPAIPENCLEPCDRHGRVEHLEIPGCGRARVYLPFGYDETELRYSVFVLLHGGGGTPEAFFPEEGGALARILDCLINSGRMAPLIVAAPTYYPDGPADTGIEGSRQAVVAFPAALRERILPLLDSRYRTLPDRDHRGIGGFSMGAVATWGAFLEDRDLFRWYLPMSGDCWALGRLGGSSRSRETADLLAEAGQGRDFFLHAVTGDRDIAFPNLNAQMEAMAERGDVFRFGSNTRYSLLPGGVHDYPDILRYIAFALPEFFTRRARPVSGVHHISLKCADGPLFEETMRFYRELLGLTLVREWPDGVLLDCGNALLEIFRNGEGIREKGAIRHIAFAAEDVDGLAERIRAAGYEVFMSPRDIVIPSDPPLPARIAFCTGPLGEEIELFHEKG